MSVPGSYTEDSVLDVFEISSELTRFQGCPRLHLNATIFKFDSSDEKRKSNEFPTSSSWKIEQLVRLLSHDLGFANNLSNPTESRTRAYPFTEKAHVTMCQVCTGGGLSDNCHAIVTQVYLPKCFLSSLVVISGKERLLEVY